MMMMMMTMRGADVSHRDAARRCRATRRFALKRAAALVARAHRERASPYDVLRVSPDATATEIKVAFRALAKATHPDSLDARAADGVAFREVMSAYSVLSDERLRAKIDAGVVLELEEFRWVDGRRRRARDAEANDAFENDDANDEEASSPWDPNYDDSDEYVKWTKPKRAKVPNVEGLTPAPSDREARVMKWRMAQFVQAWTSWCRAWHLALTTVVPLGFAAVVISQTVDASTVDFPLSTVVAALSHHAPK